MNEPTQQDPFSAPPENAAAVAPQLSAPPSPYGYPAGGYATAPVGYGGGAMPMFVGQNPREKNWMGITSLVLSLTFLFVGILGSIPAIVFGHLGLSAAKKGEADNRGVALAGVIIGYVGLGLVVLGILAYVAFVGYLFSTVGDGTYVDAAGV